MVNTICLRVFRYEAGGNAAACESALSRKTSLVFPCDARGTLVRFLL